MPRAIAIFSRRSTGAPSRISRPPRRPSVICPSSARTKATRLGKPLPTNAASERAASAPGSSARKRTLRELRARRQPDARQVRSSARARSCRSPGRAPRRATSPRRAEAPRREAPGRRGSGACAGTPGRRPRCERPRRPSTVWPTASSVERDEAPAVERAKLGTDLGCERRRRPSTSIGRTANIDVSRATA